MRQPAELAISNYHLLIGTLKQSGILTHFGIDNEIVWGIITQKLPLLKDQINLII